MYKYKQKPTVKRFYRRENKHKQIEPLIRYSQPMAVPFNSTVFKFDPKIYHKLMFWTSPL